MRDLAKRRGQHNNYKHFKKCVTTMQRENISRYYKEHVESCTDDSRKLVSLFKEYGIKQTSGKSINKIVHDKKEITDSSKSTKLHVAQKRSHLQTWFWSHCERGILFIFNWPLLIL